MVGKLGDAITTFIQSALPDLVGGDLAPVQLTISHDSFEVDPNSADATASFPRPDDRTDTLAFEPANPTGPYQLTQSPYPGARKIWLVSEEGDRHLLRPSEILWDTMDSRQFSLNLNPTRVLDQARSLTVIYGVTAIFTTLKLRQRLTLDLSVAGATDQDTNQLDAATALTIAIINLNRERIIALANAAYTGGNYGVTIQTKSLFLSQGTYTTASVRRLLLDAETELKATRTLQDSDGPLIETIQIFSNISETGV